MMVSPSGSRRTGILCIPGLPIRGARRCSRRWSKGNRRRAPWPAPQSWPARHSRATQICPSYRAGRLAGWLTTNEILIAEGLDPVEGGDTLMQPLNMGPVDGSDMTGAAPDGAGKPTEQVSPDNGPDDAAPGV